MTCNVIDGFGVIPACYHMAQAAKNVER